MELTKENNNEPETLQAGLNPQQLAQNPVIRQLGVMVGIALSVALGVAITLWSWSPNYSLLYGSLGQKEAAEVVTALQQANIDFKIDESTGAVMVPSSKLHDARMKLAGIGLPHSDSIGFELLQQDTGFGTSRALEAARYHRALEGELARTISTITNVKSSRVHLATPKQSVFVRKKKYPSASVTLQLYSGRTLDKTQVAAIVHLVASSVPELEPERITVVDQRGNMLSGRLGSKEMMLTANQFEYTKELEEHYRQRVEDILTPIIGADNLRAQVTAEVDFTITEQTAERFNPDLPALRSEQINEQSSRHSAVQGVPGALSNQPPAAGNAPELATGNTNQSEAEGMPFNTSKLATRNFELDKTISHIRHSTGNLRRLSVAVVVNDNRSVGDDGAIVSNERTPEEINRISQLVKEAIGYSATRGDSVQVINASFLAPAPQEALPELPLWEQPKVWDLAKQIGGLLLVMLLIMFVLRPTMKRLTAPPVIERIESDNEAEESGEDEEEAEALEKGKDFMQLSGPEKYEDTLEAAKQLVQEDPKRVAQVVRSWVAEDAG